MANRYWVGGTAAWDGTAGSKWALTSGGAGGQAIPTSADDVFFDAASGAVTCTVSGTRVAKSINCTGFTGTLAGTATPLLNVSGSVTFVAGMTLTFAGRITFLATGTFTSGGKTVGDVTVSGSGITVTLGSALTLGITNTFTLTQGALNLNGFTLSAGIFSSNNTNTRSIAFGSGNIALTSTTAATEVLLMTDATNFTFTGTGGFTRNQAATATVTFGTSTGSVTNAPNLTVTAGASALTITGNSWFKNTDFTGSSCAVTGFYVTAGNTTLASGGTYTSLSFISAASGTIISNGKTINGFTVDGAGITVTLGDALTIAANSGFSLSQGTLDLNGFTLSTGTFISNTTNTRSIAFGAANIALTSTTAAAVVLDMSDLTGFTYTGTGGFTRNQAATATVQYGGFAGGLTGDTTKAVNFTVLSGSSALTFSAASWFNNLNFTGSTSTVTASSVNIAGNLTLATGGTYTAVTPTYRDSGTVTSSGKTLSALTVNGSGITVTCADALTTTGALTLTDGTLKLKDGATSTVGSLVTSGTTLKYLQSTTAGTQATISDASGTNTVTYLSIQDIAATGGAKFDANSSTNVNGGNNTGWLFASLGNMFLMF
jgi:hypothetical protein